MAQLTNQISCIVDVYPYEVQGSYKLTGAEVLQCQTQKNIKQDVGSFNLVLAPVTLTGQLSWTQLITPMSMVVISFKRGSQSGVVMIGLVTTCTEGQQWDGPNGVQRTINVQGVDIAYYFMMSDFYSLWYLTVTAEQSVATLSAGLLSGNPGTIGFNWFTQIMTNTSGVFANTYLPYKESKINFPQLFSYRFDQYPSFVPYGDYFLGANGPWMNKFKTIFPFPIYEFFVTTAPLETYDDSTTGITAGTEILGSTSAQNLGAYATVVARINPVPTLTATVGNGNATAFTGIDTSAWNALPFFDLEGAGFIESNVAFTEQEVYNFYNINPSWMNSTDGKSNGTIIPGVLLYTYALDRASAARYGFRPMMFEIPWFADPTGAGAIENGQGTQQTFSNVLASIAGYYEATPLMARGDVRTFLRPDIQPGCKFSYNPFRNRPQNASQDQQSALWDFYIDGVSHNYVFGQRSFTTLSLSRGLPHSVYEDTSTDGFLFNIHIGNAQRVNGQYQIGLPPGSPQSLQSFTPNQLSDLINKLNKFYITPNATQVSG